MFSTWCYFWLARQGKNIGKAGSFQSRAFLERKITLDFPAYCPLDKLLIAICHLVVWISLLSWITMGWGWGGFNYSMSSHLGLLKCIFLSLCFTQLLFSPCLGKYLIDYHLWGIPSLFLLLFPNHLSLSSCPGWGGTEFSASFPHKTWEMDSFQVFIVVM